MDIEQAGGTSLNEAEIALAGMLSQPEGEVELSIPDDPNPEQIWVQLNNLLRIHRKADRLAMRTRPLIGKFLLMARDNPETFTRHGFKNYEQFLSEYVVEQMGMSRSSLYDARLLAVDLPGLTPDQFADLGVTKAKVLASFTNTSDPSFPKYLEEAKRHTAAGFKRWAEDHGHTEKGEHDFASIVIYTNRSIADLWNEFVALPEIQSYVGSCKTDIILKSMLQECRGSWTDWQNGIRD